MRDEFEDEELETDPSTRKKATDWLMQVISARKPINLHLNGSPYEEDGESAVAVEELAEEPVPVNLKWAGEFGAEDLCGAPAVPVVKMQPMALNGKSEVTADDVCWVPEDRRLKPQPPPPPAEPAPRVLQMSSPVHDSQKEPEIMRPEPRKSSPTPVEEFYGRTNLAADPVSRRSPDEVAIEDISRDPAPYVVEPMPSWGAFSESFHASDILDRPITESDIARDWVVQSVEPPEERGRDGVVLPFSFKVLKSKDGVLAESASAAAAQLASAAPDVGSRIETVAIVEEVHETAMAGAAEAPALPELPALTVAAELESASATAAGPESTAAIAEEAPITAESVAPVIEAAVEVGPSPMSVPEPQPLETAQPESHFSPMEAEEISPVPEATSTEEVAAAPETAHQPESVFAREGFWNGAVPGEVTARQETPLDVDVKPSYATAQGENIDESSKPPEEWVSAWKALLRIGSVLPWMAKTLPAGEAGITADGAGAPGEVRQDVAGLRLVQYEIRTTVQDHTLQLKRMDEQLGRIRESLESRSSDSDLVENVESMNKMVRIVGAGLGALVLVLILLVAILLAHGH